MCKSWRIVQDKYNQLMSTRSCSNSSSTFIREKTDLKYVQLHLPTGHENEGLSCWGKKGTQKRYKKKVGPIEIVAEKSISHTGK